MRESKNLWHEDKTPEEINEFAEFFPDDTIFNLVEDVLCIKEGYVTDQTRREIEAAALRKAESEFRKMGYPRAADNLMVMARMIEQGE